MSQKKLKKEYQKVLRSKAKELKVCSKILKISIETDALEPEAVSLILDTCDETKELLLNYIKDIDDAI